MQGMHTQIEDHKPQAGSYDQTNFIMQLVISTGMCQKSTYALVNSGTDTFWKEEAFWS